MSTLAVLLDPSDVAVIPWAARIAGATGRPLRVLAVTRATPPLLEKVDPSKRRDDTPEVVARALDAVAPIEGMEVAVYDCRASDVRRAVLDAVADLDARQLVVHATLETKAVLLPGMIERIARAAPCEVVMLDDGAVANARPKRILVPQLAGGGDHAMLTALRGIGGADAPVLVVPDPAFEPKSKRTFTRLCERVPPDRLPRLTQLQTPSEPLEEALPKMVEGDDLVVLDASEAKDFPRHVGRMRELRRERPEIRCALAIARAADAHGPGRIARLMERVRLHAPRLTREERKDLHDRLESGGRMSTDFIVMLTLSTAIAAFGLIVSSTATVIGAMLVAPLMTPLVAAGMAIVQGNLKMLQAALRAICFGVLGAMLVSVLIGTLSPWRDLSSELIARGAPNLFDLGIALFSGMAAAYALARPGLAGTLVGVAIAVALVPPLATVGIAVVQGHPIVSLGALVLFATNFVAIIIGTAITFWFFGMKIQRRDEGTEKWVRRTVAALVVALVAVAAPLSHNLVLQMREGVGRALARPLSPRLRAAIAERVSAEPGVAIVLMGQTTVGDEVEVKVILSCAGSIDPRLQVDLHALVDRLLGDDSTVQVVALRAADPMLNVPNPPDDDGAPASD